MIFNDDCFNVFQNIENKTIDLVCVDLPYGQTKCGWDSCIDLTKMWANLERIGKNTCWFVFFCTTKFGYSLLHSKLKWFRYDIVYEKNIPVGFFNANIQPLRKHEMIYIFRNPKYHNPIYNPIYDAGKPYKSIRNSGETLYGNISAYKVDNKGTRHQTSIFRTKGGNNKAVHPTQKPLDILEKLIKMYSNENDTVLDFTAGSGSTAIACINTNRRYICIEKEQKYYDIMYRRIYIRTLEVD